MIPEAAVVALAAALYLFDCIVLLERGQALLSRSSLAFGSNHYQIRGKVVALLNPLTPFIPVIRVLPLFSVSSGPKASTAFDAVRPLAICAFAQFFLVFAALPYCLYRAPGWPFLIALVLSYGNAIVMLGVFWWRFRGAGIPTRPLPALGFAWLVCLPLSVNALRKAGLVVEVAMDALQAIRTLPEPEQERARGDLGAQLAEAMQELDENDERHRRLADLRQQLAPEAVHGRI